MRHSSTARPHARISGRSKASPPPSRPARRHQTPGVTATADQAISTSGLPARNYAVTTTLRTITFEITPSDPPFLGTARGPAQAARLARSLIPRDGLEHFGMFFLNNNLDVLGYHELAVSTLDCCLLSPREVYGAALRVMGTARIILVHNHPSGNPELSREDIVLTRRLAKAGDLLDIELADHVILGDPGYVSFTARGMLLD